MTRARPHYGAWPLGLSEELGATYVGVSQNKFRAKAARSFFGRTFPADEGDAEAA